ncbi:MAG: hypothetical protein QOG84_1521 [Sphingomonadales bacterium]|nr:hypothetical protein [Sphingomonadales bacterium]
MNQATRLATQIACSLGLLSAASSLLAAGKAVAAADKHATASQDSTGKNQKTQVSQRAPDNADEKRDEWLGLLANGIVAIVAGFGAAIIGARATRRASQEAAVQSLEAVRVAQEAEVWRDLARRKQALRYEIGLNLRLLQTEGKVLRRIPLQSSRLAAYMELNEPDIPLGSDWDDATLYIHKYNSFLSLANEGNAQTWAAVLTEIEKIRSEGISLLERLQASLQQQ